MANRKTALNDLRRPGRPVSRSYEQLMALIDEADASAAGRGHTLSWLMVDTGWSRGKCTRCAREVDVKLNPAANDIAIGGSAVALNCQP